VSHRGLISVDRARIWSLPDTPPELFGAAVSPETARRVGGWADGLITVNQTPDTLRQVIDAFREGGGEEKPAALQVHLSWADDEETAREIAYDQWRTNVFGGVLSWELETPEQFDAASAHVRPEDLDASVLISADPGRHASWLAGLAELGFDRLFLHHVGQSQDRFIEVFGEKVIPELGS
jgi:alkanesulfonate monooxygenase SsuD/methylene tetrahydromethanopterin reductase-like flavin-dependent oxidoreductase (luciferase family)